MPGYGRRGPGVCNTPLHTSTLANAFRSAFRPVVRACRPGGAGTRRSWRAIVDGDQARAETGVDINGRRELGRVTKPECVSGDCPASRCRELDPPDAPSFP